MAQKTKAPPAPDSNSIQNGPTPAQQNNMAQNGPPQQDVDPPSVPPPATTSIKGQSAAQDGSQDQAAKPPTSSMPPPATLAANNPSTSMPPSDTPSAKRQSTSMPPPPPPSANPSSSVMSISSLISPTTNRPPTSTTSMPPPATPSAIGQTISILPPAMTWNDPLILSLPPAPIPTGTTIVPSLISLVNTALQNGRMNWNVIVPYPIPDVLNAIIHLQPINAAMINRITTLGNQLIAAHPQPPNGPSTLEVAMINGNMQAAQSITIDANVIRSIRMLRDARVHLLALIIDISAHQRRIQIWAARLNVLRSGGPVVQDRAMLTMARIDTFRQIPALVPE